MVVVGSSVGDDVVVADVGYRGGVGGGCDIGVGGGGIGVGAGVCCRCWCCSWW